MAGASTATFGDLLRRYRAVAGLTQEELAGQSGLSVEAISALERGTRHTPRKDTVLLLVEALQLGDEQRDSLLAARRREVSSNTLRQVEVAEPSGGIGPSVQTFLVVGMRGYARLAPERGEALATRVASRFATIVREVIAATGGRVVHLQGAQAVAVFTLPRQALQTAVALRARCGREAASHFPLPISIGLDAGEATPAEGSHTGGVTAVAARLAGLAAPGEVLASEGVIHLARKIAGLYYLERGVAQLKGVEEAVRIVQVLSEPPQAAAGTAAVAPEPASARNDAGTALLSDASPPETPSEPPLPIGGFLGALPDGAIVARETELAELCAALEAVRNRQGRCVLLAGEPGVGKTRLAQEATVEARGRDFLVATGRCYELQRSVPFFPFREALAAAYAAAPPALRDEVAAHWPDVLRLLPIAPDESANTASAADTPPAGELAGQEEQQRLFWAVTGFVRALADMRPVALLVDDLQWADSASLDLVQHLARHTRACRVFLLGIYRDDEVSRTHPLQAVLRDLSREHLLQRLAVKRLPAEGTTALVRSLMGEDEVPPALVALIHRGTDGNALFARELLRALVERGDVERHDGRWEPRAGITIEAPESVRAVIRQRLEHLSPTAQEVLQEASILGQTFSFDDLQAMRDRPEVEVEAALDAAQAAGLIRESGTSGGSGALGADRYAFQHGLIQQGIYADLPGRRRQRYHRVAGEQLARLGERERARRAAELAWHFVEGGVPEAALPYALLAGDQAEVVFAHHDAERHYQSALELARELGERGCEAEALYKLGALWMTTARYDDAVQMLERSAEVARSGGDLEGRRRAMALLGRVYARRGAAREGVQRIQPLLATMTGEPSRGVAALQIALADLYYTSGRYREQLAAAERAAEIARSLKDDALLAQAEQWRSSALLALGRAQEALPVLQEVIPRAEAAGDFSSHTHALSHVALAYIQRGEFDEGRRYIERALSLAERRGDPAQTAFMAYNRGMIAVYTGEWKQARADYERAAAVMRQVGLAWTSAYPLLGLGHLSLVEGRWEEASRYLQQAIALAERSGDAQALRYAQVPLIERDLLDGRTEVARARLDRLFDPRGSGRYEGMAQLLALAAWTRLELGDVAQAGVLVTQARAQAEAEQNRLALVEALRVQAMVLQRQAKRTAAVESVERALELSRAMPCPHQTARVLYTYGTILKDQAKDAPARQRLQEAQALLAPLGERLYAQHVEAALAELGPHRDA